MPDLSRKQLLRTPPLLWLAGFVAIAILGGSLTADLGGFSHADQFVVARWSFEGLRIYLWLEALVLVAIVASLGFHVISVGFAVARDGPARLLGAGIRTSSRVPRQAGYIFVLLGAGLVALSLTTVVLFNSCRYMRLI